MQKHIARKRFGQHFLIDPQVIGDIVRAIVPRREDRLVEIGPGLGALTELLLPRLDHLHVIEIDRDIVARLRQRFDTSHTASGGRLTIHAGDALTFDFSELVSGKAGALRIVGNLPYNISTPLLFHLATYAESIRDMHFMLQKEVVARMAAAPDTPDYGRLSVMLQYRFFVDPLFDVPPEAFAPAPKVDSTVVRLIPRLTADLTALNAEKLAEIVAAAFSQRRKMLRNTLSAYFSEADWARLKIAPMARAEMLSVDEYVHLANAALAGDSEMDAT